MNKIDTLQKLRELYGEPSFRAREKVQSTLDKHSIHFISKSPFLVLSSVSNQGNLDASPRGGNPGFVKILNEKSILIPDFKGNNRVDSLSNIVQTNEIGLLFMVPGIEETLRLNGKAVLTTDEGILNQCREENKLPIAVLQIEVKEVFLHCAKAFMRSKLWNIDQQIKKEDFPTMGQMLKDQLKLNDEPESRENMVKRYKKTLY